MRIVTLSATDLKGRNFRQTLGPLNLIVGNNASGKTAYAEAIKLALFGHDPAIGKQAGATAELATGTRMDVSAEFDKLGANTLTLKPGKGGACSVSWNAVIKPPLMLLDFGNYTSLTSQERIAMVAGMVETPKFDDDDFRDKVRGMAVSAPAAVTNKVVHSASELLETTIAARISAGHTIPEWLVNLTTKAKDKAKSFGVTAKTLASQLEALVPGPNPGDVSVKLDTANATLQKCTATYAALSQKAQDFQASKARDKSNRDLVSQLPALRKELKRLQGEHDTATSDVPSQETMLAATSLPSEIEAKLRAENTRWSEATGKMRVLNDRKVRILKETACPCCKVDGVEWKARWKQGHTAEESACSAVIASSTAEMEKIRGELKAAQANAEAINQKWSQSTSRVLVIGKAIVESTAKIALAERVGKQLKADAAESNVGVTADELQQAVCAQENAAEEVRVLSDANTQFTVWALKRSQRDLTERQLIEAQAMQEGFKSLADKATAYLRDFVTESFGKVLVNANRFTDGFLPGPLVYDPETDDIGYRLETGKIVTHRVFSGMEKAIAYAGLCVGLCQKSEIKLVLIDDCIIDDERKSRIFGRMESLIGEGIVDQFIMMDVRDNWLTPHQRQTVRVVQVK